jgi:hypothetical protein
MARTCNPVIRSHRVDSEKAGKIAAMFCVNGEFHVDIGTCLSPGPAHEESNSSGDRH